MFGFEKLLKRATPTKVAMATLLTSLALGATASSAFATDHYVSFRSGIFGTQSGDSWENGWRDVKSIDWSKVQPGDKIILDAGSYFDGMKIQKSGTAGAPITITTSNEPGHNGDVSFTLFDPNAIGIDFGDQQYVSVIGQKRSSYYGGEPQKSIKIKGFIDRGKYGAYLGPNSYANHLENIEFQGKKGNLPIRQESRLAYFDHLVLQDSRIDLVPMSSYGYLVMYNCWLTSTVFTEFTGDGLTTTANGSASTYVSMTDCVVGPGLNKGVSLKAPGTFMANRCLFLNPAITNLEKAVANPRDLQVYLSYVTSFLTPLNQNNQGHSCLTMTSTNRDVFAYCTFYGGNVNVVKDTNPDPTLNIPTAVGVTQFKTSGNTTLLSPTQEDPQFANDISPLLRGPSWWYLFRSFNFKHKSWGSFIINSVPQLSN